MIIWSGLFLLVLRLYRPVCALHSVLFIFLCLPSQLRQTKFKINGREKGRIRARERKVMKDYVGEKMQEVKDKEDREIKRCVGCDGWSWKCGGVEGGKHPPLSDTQLCCWRRWADERCVCLCVYIAYVCVCVCAACTVNLGTSGGLTDYLSRSRLEGSLSLSLPHFPQSLTGLAPSNNAQGHCNTVKVVQDTSNWRVSQHFSSSLHVKHQM